MIRRRQSGREYMERARRRAREVIEEAKSVPCMDCGGSWPAYVMHFDHVRGEKEFGIAQFANRLSGSVASMDKLLIEMAKCDVVCANCHALRHGGVYVDNFEKLRSTKI